MLHRILSCAVLSILLLPAVAAATIFGTVQGVVHDPQHRPVAGAQITVKALNSDWHQTIVTDDNGEFRLPAVPLGEYAVMLMAPGFAGEVQNVVVQSGSAPTLHFALRLATAQQEVTVSAAIESVDPQSSSSQTLVSRRQIADTPGADRSNSMAMITNFVPGAVMVHDQLHVRGGHQVTWAIDGVPVPNTNIASNVGPQFDPKDIDYLEVQRGGLSAESGDRTYGVFNVVTRSGFERNRAGELVADYGSFHAGNGQLSLGDHSERFAYYFSLNGNRSDHALETPTAGTLHDLGSGGGAFTSLIFNASPKDQVRFVGGLRGDYFQVPNDPSQQAAGIRDREREQDALANFTYMHSFSPELVLSVSPLFHFNRAAFEGGALDTPSATDNRASSYAGGQASLTLVHGRHNAKLGIFAFEQHDNTLFGLVANNVANNASGGALRQRQKLAGDLEALFLEDQYKATQWLTFNLGARFTHFAGALTETAASPRLGVALQLPRLKWVLRASYGRTYQAPPLTTISGPLLSLAANQGFGFLPLRGERDEQHEFGVSIPLRGWTGDLAAFRTGAHNFFDHDALGNSNIFFPLTIQSVRVRGFEATLRSPRLFHRGDIHLAYSRQSVEGSGAISGGLTDFSPPAAGFFFLDHDQHHTLSTGFRTDLPGHAWLTSNFTYGSGFLNGNGPEHLPSYRVLDVALGKGFGESWSARITATNLFDKRYFIDLSNTFGGSHTGDPRQVAVQVRYRFHY